MIRRRTLWLVVGLGLAALLVALLIWILLNRVAGVVTSPAPPRAVPIPLPPLAPSSIALPVRLPMALVQQAAEAAVPGTLWTIDEPDRICVPAARVKLFAARLKVTPDLRCRLTGTVNRGPIRLTGAGDGLHLVIPIFAEIHARDIGGIIAQETATASAIVTADLRPTLTPDGRLSARISLAYDWQEEPGVTLLGQRIRLTDKADAKLAPVLARAEQDMVRRLAALPVRNRLEALWRSGFTVQQVSRRNPAAWLRLTPQGVGLGSIRMEGRELQIDAVLHTLGELHLGTPPAPPQATPLPQIAAGQPGSALTLNIGVLSDYATLEAVIAKALIKVAARGITVPDYGRVNVRFRRAILYGTDDGRLALGLDLTVRGPRQILNTRGRVWLTARAQTTPGSERVLIRDVRLFTGRTRDSQLPLLVAVAQTETVRTALEDALSQDFTRDYARLMRRIDTALTNVRIGDFQLHARLANARHGQAVVLGQGLCLPVTASGSARLDYAGNNQGRPR